MRVLVTGGAGRLGRSVVDELLGRGADVVVTDIHRGSLRADVPVLTGDLTEPGDAYDVVHRAAPDAVVHLAGLPEPFSYPEHRLFRVNTLGTFNLLGAAVALGVGTAVYAGSPSPVGYGAPTGWRPDYLPIDEAHPLLPWHAYGLSKVVGEQTLQTLVRQSGGALRGFTVRPCFVVTPEDWTSGAVTQGGKTIVERLDDPSIAAGSLFNYVDARDAARLIAATLDRAGTLPNGEVFYACAGDALAREPLCDLIPRFHPGLAELAAPLTGTRPAFSTRKAAELLDWHPRHSWRTELRERTAAAR